MLACNLDVSTASTLCRRAAILMRRLPRQFKPEMRNRRRKGLTHDHRARRPHGTDVIARARSSSGRRLEWRAMTSRARRFCGSISLALSLGILHGACSLSTGSRPGGPSPVQFSLFSSGLPVDGIWKSTPAVVDLNGDGLPD